MKRFKTHLEVFGAEGFTLTPELKKELEAIAINLDTPDFRKKHGAHWMQVKMATAMNILKRKHGWMTDGKESHDGMYDVKPMQTGKKKKKKGGAVVQNKALIGNRN